MGRPDHRHPVSELSRTARYHARLFAPVEHRTQTGGNRDRRPDRICRLLFPRGLAAQTAPRKGETGQRIIPLRKRDLTTNKTGAIHIRIYRQPGDKNVSRLSLFPPVADHPDRLSIHFPLPKPMGSRKRTTIWLQCIMKQTERISLLPLYQISVSRVSSMDENGYKTRPLHQRLHECSLSV
jgi:hypothetical protein